jgi:hypothetical protein
MTAEEFASNLGSGVEEYGDTMHRSLDAALARPRETDAAEVEATIEHYRWLRANLPLDNLGHITSCAAVEGDNCRCATFAQRLAAHDAQITAAAEQAAGERMRLVRQVEADMSEEALKAWRSAGARRGLSDHDALLVHADALTRWSERFRRAFDGDDYRDDRPARSVPAQSDEGSGQ